MLQKMLKRFLRQGKSYNSFTVSVDPQQFVIVGASEAVNIRVRERLVNVHVRTRKAFLQKIADREKIMESAEVLLTSINSRNA